MYRPFASDIIAVLDAPLGGEFSQVEREREVWAPLLLPSSHPLMVVKGTQYYWTLELK